LSGNAAPVVPAGPRKPEEEGKMTIRSDLSKMVEKKGCCTADEISVEIIVYLCKLDILDPNQWLEDDPVMQGRLDEMYPDYLDEDVMEGAGG
jgi:hypothetical protein